MSDTQADRQQDIESLLGERKKFEAWLAQLDAKRATAAPHVYERVHADYTKRLDDVRGRLRDEADTVRTLVSDLETRLGKELDRVTRKSDERAEAELRAMVGEYSEKEWNTTRSKMDAAIADLRAKFDGTERELADLKELLASVTGAPAPARPSVMRAAAVLVADALDEAAATDASDASDAAPEAPAAAAAPVPEAKTPAPPSKEAPVSKAGGAGEKPAPAEPPARRPSFDELAFLRSVAGTPSRASGIAAVPTNVAPPPADAALPEAMKIDLTPDEPPPAAEPPEEKATRPRTSSTVEAEPGPLGAPTPRTSQAIRSLKCQECGTLNFPTEWYCERCGGELAAF